jgi:hypothetical protein
MKQCDKNVNTQSEALHQAKLEKLYFIVFNIIQQLYSYINL